MLATAVAPLQESISAIDAHKTKERPQQLS